MRSSVLMKVFMALCLACGPLVAAGPASGSDNIALDVETMKKQFETMQKQLGVLEQKVAAQDREIKQEQAAKSDAQKRIADLETQLKSQPASSTDTSASGKWNPAIGVIADVVFKLDTPKEDEEGADRVSVRELEIVFGSDIDPYSRLDATVAFSDFEEASLEEAYMTRFGLPLDTTARFGKFKPKIGRALQLHRDSLDTVDHPLVIRRYFGHEGYNKAGLDATTLLNFGLPLTQELSLGVLEGGNGEEGTLFGDTRRRPTLYGHLKNYYDVTDDTGVQWGWSYLTGSRDEDSSFEVQVIGSDLTFNHRFNANQALKLQSEVFNVNRRETEDADGNIWGWYALADARVAPQWGLGLRYDSVQPVDNPLDSEHRRETGYTGYLTFYQTEFARWRLQTSQFKDTDGVKDNQVMIQGTFAIGEHKHKIQ